jgi:hypothetical protein
MINRNKPPPISITPSTPGIIKRSSPKKSARSLAPPSPRIDLSIEQDYSLYGYILLVVSLVYGAGLVYLLERNLLFYGFLAVAFPLVCLFRFFNWLGLKYFRHNA